MENKTFTRLELFSITDGRLVSMADVYNTLNYIFSLNLFTHDLPVYYNKLIEINPSWFANEKIELEKIKTIVGNDFETLIDYIEKNCNIDIQVEKI